LSKASCPRCTKSSKRIKNAARGDFPRVKQEVYSFDSIKLGLTMKSFSRSALLSVLFMIAATQQVQAQTLICSGSVGNGYLPENPEYKTFGDRTFVIKVECSAWVQYFAGSGECSYSFNGSRYQGYLFSNGDFDLPHLDLASMSGNTLMFKMSEQTDGVVGNEGQRWFFGACVDAE
jgi:hypothetical protein